MKSLMRALAELLVTAIVAGFIALLVHHQYIRYDCAGLHIGRVHISIEGLCTPPSIRWDFDTYEEPKSSPYIDQRKV